MKATECLFFSIIGIILMVFLFVTLMDIKLKIVNKYLVKKLKLWFRVIRLKVG